MPLVVLLPTVMLLLASFPAAEAHGVEAMTEAQASSEVNKALTWLNANGYSTLVRQIRTTPLPSQMITALVHWKQFTILAPNNAAFTRFTRSGRPCEPGVRFVLGLHVLPKKLPATSVLALKVGDTEKSVTAVPITKIALAPLTLGVMDGLENTLSSAKVVAGNAYVGPYIIVHGIDSVLRYPAGTGC